MSKVENASWPQIKTVGFDGFLVCFGGQLDEASNRAALAFRAAVIAAKIPGVEECSTSLVSTYVRFDPLLHEHQVMHAALVELVSQRDWYTVALPQGRRLWRIPTVFGGALAPQLAETARVAGMTEAEATTSISKCRVRVQTIGFAPGMPYFGELEPEWDLPRQTTLTDRVPAGGLCVAIRQLVLFPVATPTGWRHIGQTALRLFRPNAQVPFVFRPGDEAIFEPVSEQELTRLFDQDDGGAVCEDIL